MTAFCATCLAETWDFDPTPLSPTSSLEWEPCGDFCPECHSEVWWLRHTVHGFVLPGGDEYRVLRQEDGDLLVRALLPAGYQETVVSRCPRCSKPFYNAVARECPDCRVPLLPIAQPR